jgi:hypothetical protein
MYVCLVFFVYVCMCMCMCVCVCVCVCVCKRESAGERTRERKRERESQQASEREREREGESQREKTQYGFLAAMSLGTQCAWSVKMSLYLSLTQTIRTFSHTREPARKDAKWRVRCNTLQHTARLEWWGPWSINSKHGAHMRACANRHVCCNTQQHTATHSNTLQHTSISEWWGPDQSIASTVRTREPVRKDARWRVRCCLQQRWAARCLALCTQIEE